MDWTERTKNGTSFTGSDVDVFRACALASALKLYADTKMRVNRAYTPTRMLQAATAITGVPFRRGQYREAETVLQSWIDAAKSAPRHDAAMWRERFRSKE